LHRFKTRLVVLRCSGFSVQARMSARYWNTCINACVDTIRARVGGVGCCHWITDTVSATMGNINSPENFGGLGGVCGCEDSFSANAGLYIGRKITSNHDKEAHQDSESVFNSLIGALQWPTSFIDQLLFDLILLYLIQTWKKVFLDSSISDRTGTKHSNNTSAKTWWLPQVFLDSRSELAGSLPQYVGADIYAKGCWSGRIGSGLSVW
jgi:hypothetical protein